MLIPILYLCSAIVWACGAIEDVYKRRFSNLYVVLLILLGVGIAYLEEHLWSSFLMFAFINVLGIFICGPIWKPGDIKALSCLFWVGSEQDMSILLLFVIILILAGAIYGLWKQRKQKSIRQHLKEEWILLKCLFLHLPLPIKEESSKEDSLPLTVQFCLAFILFAVCKIGGVWA